ncbi:MAG TPA: polysaccharide deacetylase family protein [Gemmatimonadaceae bacterium]|nr:polysaccharide deacetylase family protein [Gemmatimonadaceae bacterium]
MSVRIPILMYHEVTPTPIERYRKYSLTPSELASQLEWLRDHGYTAVDLDSLTAAWRGERTLPSRPVVLTFDDGSRDCLEHAVPALLGHGFTATFFIVAGLVGSTTRWLPALTGFELPTADWPTLRAAERDGMRCEAHSVTHPRLATLPDDECRDELSRGRAILEDGLGHVVRHLAYPFGSNSARTRELAREAGYETACTTHEGLAGAGDDPLGLPRVPVLGTEGMGEFPHRVRSARPVGPLQASVQSIRRRLGAAVRRRPPA